MSINTLEYPKNNKGSSIQKMKIASLHFHRNPHSDEQGPLTHNSWKSDKKMKTKTWFDKKVKSRPTPLFFRKAHNKMITYLSPSNRSSSHLVTTSDDLSIDMPSSEISVSQILTSSPFPRHRPIDEHTGGQSYLVLLQDLLAVFPLTNEEKQEVVKMIKSIKAEDISEENDPHQHLLNLVNSLEKQLKKERETAKTCSVQLNDQRIELEKKETLISLLRSFISRYQLQSVDLKKRNEMLSRFNHVHKMFGDSNYVGSNKLINSSPLYTIYKEKEVTPEIIKAQLFSNRDYTYPNNTENESNLANQQTNLLREKLMEYSKNVDIPSKSLLPNMTFSELLKHLDELCLYQNSTQIRLKENLALLDKFKNDIFTLRIISENLSSHLFNVLNVIFEHKNGPDFINRLNDVLIFVSKTWLISNDVQLQDSTKNFITEKYHHFCSDVERISHETQQFIENEKHITLTSQDRFKLKTSMENLLHNLYDHLNTNLNNLMLQGDLKNNTRFSSEPRSACLDCLNKTLGNITNSVDEFTARLIEGVKQGVSQLTAKNLNLESQLKMKDDEISYLSNKPTIISSEEMIGRNVTLTIDPNIGITPLSISDDASFASCQTDFNTDQYIKVEHVNTQTPLEKVKTSDVYEKEVESLQNEIAALKKELSSLNLDKKLAFMISILKKHIPLIDDKIQTVEVGLEEKVELPFTALKNLLNGLVDLITSFVDSNSDQKLSDYSPDSLIHLYSVDFEKFIQLMECTTSKFNSFKNSLSERELPKNYTEQISSLERELEKAKTKIDELMEAIKLLENENKSKEALFDRHVKSSLDERTLAVNSIFKNSQVLFDMIERIEDHEAEQKAASKLSLSVNTDHLHDSEFHPKNNEKKDELSDAFNKLLEKARLDLNDVEKLDGEIRYKNKLNKKHYDNFIDKFNKFANPAQSHSSSSINESQNETLQPIPRSNSTGSLSESHESVESSMLADQNVILL